MGKTTPTVPEKGSIDYGEFGLEGYVNRHLGTYVTAKELEDETNKFMGGFRVHESKNIRNIKRMRTTPDEEGFIQVVPKLYSRKVATTQMPRQTSLDDYYNRQEKKGAKKATVSSDVFSAFAQTKKNMQRLVKMKKTLMKATDRKKAGTSVSLRNFADRC
eukprot:TRINITY_DN46326_c0_g1_i1.p2 TRINITY_DN46326_c0_g1~~TRINITY_DN46326_c0_g1_i1.p2  ORF type:complete len:160 (+),score=71.35 TRINITY_DN46326_c0_g1_i1:162-641(+)